METFLSIVAHDLYQKLNGHFEHLTLVFPNKRAGIFFQQALTDLATDKPLWLPRFTTLTDLFAERSTYTQADTLLLICRLYQSFLHISHRNLPLDKFYSWGNMMLNDFDDVDNNLIDAAKLFQNLTDLNNLTDFSFLSEAQVKAIQQLFSGFDPENLSPLKRQFLQFWNILLPIYEDFHTNLQHDHIAYAGMLRRHVIEQLQQSALEEDPHRTYAFVGFNVLSQTEYKLMQHLRDHCVTHFYWDYDIAYLNDHQSEAAHFIRQNIQHFGSALPTTHSCFDHLSQPKDLRCIAAPTEEAQVHYAATRLREVAPTAPWTETAIVLANEGLLTSLTHTLPDQMPINVTMGFPLQQTVVAGWVRLLLNLQHTGFSDAKHLRGPIAMQVLRHPYTARISGQQHTTLIQHLRQHPQPYPAISTLALNDTLQLLFTPQPTNAALLNWMLTLLQLLGITYADTAPESLDTLAAESVFTTYTLVSRLHQFTQTNLLDVQPETLMRLILQMISDRKIPFHGEPAEGIQVMGMLETRNLDFQHVILLSLNEGNLPKNEHQPSFIPYNLREAYGLTTREQRTSLAAYYFYRLLQRAHTVTILYNNTADGQHTGEVSRFVNQILLDTCPTLHLPIQRQTLTAVSIPSSPQHISVPKTTHIVNQLHQRGLLSPSALNVYINCPLHFYYQYIENLRETNEQGEEVSSDVFGTIFHHVMEQIYTQIFPLRQTLQSQQLLSLATNTKLLRHLVNQAFAEEYFHTNPDHADQLRYNGDQCLKREVIIRLIRTQLRYDATLCPLTILAVEYPCYGSRIDRIDRVTINGQPQLRVVDYKTSSQAQTTPAQMEKLFDTNVKQRAYHVFQIFYYSLLLTDSDLPKQYAKPTTPAAPAAGTTSSAQQTTSAQKQKASTPTIDFHAQPLAPSLMYAESAFRSGKPVSPLLTYNRVPLTDFCNQVSDEFHTLLHHLLEEIYDPNVPFTQTTNTEHCTYCPFIDICRQPHPTA